MWRGVSFPRLTCSATVRRRSETFPVGPGAGSSAQSHDQIPSHAKGDGAALREVSRAVRGQRRGRAAPLHQRIGRSNPPRPARPVAPCWRPRRRRIVDVRRSAGADQSAALRLPRGGGIGSVKTSGVMPFNRSNSFDLLKGRVRPATNRVQDCPTWTAHPVRPAGLARGQSHTWPAGSIPSPTMRRTNLDGRAVDGSLGPRREPCQRAASAAGKRVVDHACSTGILRAPGVVALHSSSTASGRWLPRPRGPSGAIRGALGLRPRYGGAKREGNGRQRGPKAAHRQQAGAPGLASSSMPHPGGACFSLP